MLGGVGQEVTERGGIACAFGLSGAAQERGGLPDPVFGQRPVGRGDGGLEAFAGQGQVVGERRTGKPHQLAAAVRAVPGERPPRSRPGRRRHRDAPARAGPRRGAGRGGRRRPARAGPRCGRCAAAAGRRDRLALPHRPPRPDDLRAIVDHLATDERSHVMDDLPWIAAVGGSREKGLRRCVRKMHPPTARPRRWRRPQGPAPLRAGTRHSPTRSPRTWQHGLLLVGSASGGTGPRRRVAAPPQAWASKAQANTAVTHVHRRASARCPAVRKRSPRHSAGEK